VYGKLRPLFERIQEVSKPETVDGKWLSSIGFTGSNDPRLVPVLKFIGFLDPSGKPTEKWLAYRDRNRAKQVLAEGIRDGYAGLFKIYPDANQRRDDELKNFFGARTGASARVIVLTTATFRSLCELADFRGATEEAVPEPSGTQVTEVDRLAQTRVTAQGLGGQITININVQLTLPDTTDETVYDRFFAALKKHLLP
jgi:hypothetical protein